VPYSLWFKPQGGSVIAESLSLEQITGDKVAAYRNYLARPVDAQDPTAPWITGRKGALEAVSKVLGASDYRAKAGVCTWLNGVYWLQIIGQRPDGLVVVRNVNEGAKREVESVQAAIEPDLLYPLLRGRDVERWRAVPQAHLLMVQDPVKRRGYDEDWLSVTYPRTYAYLKRFEAILRTRSGYKRYFGESDPFYSLFDVGDYTFAPYKVVWRGEVAPELIAAVVEKQGETNTVPDQTVYFIGLPTKEEAHFVCAILNSMPVRGHYRMRGYKHVSMAFIGRLSIPTYSPQDSLHRDLSALSQAAHAATAAGDAARVHAIEAEIDRAAARLWGLTDEELEEIQKSLAELG
jgi:hypothetical protein